MILIKLQLNGEIEDKFVKIKQKYGIENNTDILRLLISDHYQRLII